MFKQWVLLVIAIHVSNAQEVRLNFFQNDYDVKLHIAEVAGFNKSCFKFCEASFVLYNRTERVLNASWELLFDAGNNFMYDVQMYKFMSNEYRFFPVTFTANLCAEYRKDSFGLKGTIDKTTNLTPCNMKKGIYYIRNSTSDSSRFPPHLPVGSYKVILQLVFRSFPCAEFHFYLILVDKPVDWIHIPKMKIN